MLVIYWTVGMTNSVDWVLKYIWEWLYANEVVEDMRVLMLKVLSLSSKYVVNLSLCL